MFVAVVALICGVVVVCVCVCVCVCTCVGLSVAGYHADVSAPPVLCAVAPPAHGAAGVARHELHAAVSAGADDVTPSHFRRLADSVQ